MKIRIVLIGMIFLSFLASGCRKCLSCQHIDSKTGTVIYDFPRTCGNKTSLTSQELNYRSNTPDTLELKCERIKDE